MKRWKLFVLAGGLFVSLIAPPAHAVTVFKECGENAQTAVCKASKSEDATSMAKKVINVMLFALGITAVFMIIWGSIKYVISRGDPANIKAAKDTVMYAVVGLVVALFAYAIVNFVIGALK
jgi:uncharacterized membrane protein